MSANVNKNNTEPYKFLVEFPHFPKQIGREKPSLSLSWISRVLSVNSCRNKRDVEEERAGDRVQFRMEK